jgi:hypothetical protein
MARAWITYDGEELLSMSTIEWMKEYHGLARQIRTCNGCQDFRDPDQRQGYYRAYDAAAEIVEHKGVFSRFDFEAALRECIQSPIKDSLESRNPLLKALSMLDRRVGKRRLRAMRLSRTEHSLVRRFYALRCRAEGMV